MDNAEEIRKLNLLILSLRRKKATLLDKLHNTHEELKETLEKKTKLEMQGKP